MADKKISQLNASTTPLVGTEELAIVQSGITKKVSVDNLTVGKAVEAKSLTALFAGNAEITATRTAGASVKIQAQSSVGVFGTFTNSDLNLVTNNSTKMRVRTGGDVQIESGNLVIGTAGKGIDFSADGQAAGMTSELLDDYEEGTWTPTKTTGTAFTSVSGRYTKIGNQVTATFLVQFAVEANGASAAVSGFPFAANGAASEINGLAVGYQSASVNVGGSLSVTTMNFRLIGTGSASGASINQMSGAIVTGTMVYTI
jgi:hypothetical protein